MEAYAGGPIGAIRNGDIIEMDIPCRRLNVNLSPVSPERVYWNRLFSFISMKPKKTFFMKIFLGCFRTS